MSSTPSRVWSPARAIVTGGVIAGLLDITYAFIYSGLKGTKPLELLQTISSGLLGQKAFEGGIATAALGGFFQLFIPTAAATVYYGIARALPALRRHAVASGIVFGVGIYVVMYFVVLPLSAIPFKPNRSLAAVVPGLLAHMFLIGLPIALANRKSAPVA